LAQQRPAGRSHGEAMAAIGQGDLCGAFLVAGFTCCEHLMAGPSPIWKMQRGFPRCGDGATAKRQRQRRGGSPEAAIFGSLGFGGLGLRLRPRESRKSIADLVAGAEPRRSDGSDRPGGSLRGFPRCGPYLLRAFTGWTLTDSEPAAGGSSSRGRSHGEATAAAAISCGDSRILAPR
jgi:hypothetical protein